MTHDLNELFFLEEVFRSNMIEETSKLFQKANYDLIEHQFAGRVAIETLFLTIL